MSKFAVAGLGYVIFSYLYESNKGMLRLTFSKVAAEVVSETEKANVLPYFQAKRDF